jgi:signal transduction histidine kinase
VVGGFDLVELADALIGVFVFLSTNAYLQSHNAWGHPVSPVTVTVVSVIVCVPVLARTRFPASAWLGSVVAIMVAHVLVPAFLAGTSDWIPQSLIIYGLCLYSVAVRCRPGLVVATAIVSLLGAAFVDERTAAASILVAFPLLAGTVVKVRRNARSQLTEQARRHEGERTLLEERQRIARELHDVVAHHMSVIAIHAEAAPYKVAEPPPELVESFSDIRASALKGMEELRRILGVLRYDTDAQMAPQPGLAGLEELLDNARGAGLTVISRTNGLLDGVPDGVDLSAYRILQEALSNAMRHAPGSTVDVRVECRDRGMFLEVRNTAGAREAPVSDGGHGIVGMRERATMLGGELDAGPTLDGGFAVSAVLPYVREAVA